MNNENKRNQLRWTMPWSNGCGRDSGGSHQRNGNDLEPLSLSNPGSAIWVAEQGPTASHKDLECDPR